MSVRGKMIAPITRHYVWQARSISVYKEIVLDIQNSTKNIQAFTG